MSRSSVSVNDDRILYLRADGTEVSIPWDDLDAATLETTDKGQGEDDLFWVLECGGARHRIPSETLGATRLMQALQKLPGFDSEAVIDASTSLEPRQFECWRRK